MEYSENFNFSLPSRDSDDVADINQVSDNFRIIDEELGNQKTILEDLEKNAVVAPESDISIAGSSDFFKLLKYYFINGNPNRTIDSKEIWYLISSGPPIRLNEKIEEIESSLGEIDVAMDSIIQSQETIIAEQENILAIQNALIGGTNE